MSRFAEVIIPLPLYGTFTYLIPDTLEESICVGSRVYVQFGKRKFYTGIIESIHSNPPKGYEIKPIVSVLDAKPIVIYPQLKFWKWIADYYLCSIGEVFKSAIPSGLKIESETFVSLNPDYDLSETDLKNNTASVIQTLRDQDRMKISEISSKTGIKNIAAIINPMLEDGLVEIAEQRIERYRPLTETVVTLNANRFDQDIIKDFFTRLKRSEKQQKLLMTYLVLSDWNNKTKDLKQVSKKSLITESGLTTAIYKSLEDKGIFSTEKIVINRFKKFIGNRINSPAQLSESQQIAFKSIIEEFRTHNVVLLHGVTGSGKTEIYANLIDRVLKEKKQVLYLVPEISLTTHLTDRLRRLLGDRLLVYHSKFSDNERVDIWSSLLNSRQPLVVLGVRSSIYLPFSNLGLVIVDEEHESSFKQFDPAPRYNARDAAIMLANMHGAKTLLGSATPSIETYYKASTGKYGLVTLTERFGTGKLPEVEIVGIPQQRKQKEMKGILSKPLYLATKESLDSGNQAIIFQNRRGFAPVVVCKECGWSPKCINCDVSLIYHKKISLLRCHYCGYSTPLPSLCPACGLNGIEIFGYGTERIAEEMHETFPDAKIVRMDLDTTRNKESLQHIIEDFSEGKSNLLVGTQMVSKGLDFRKVKIVGVINADTLLNFPDFRSDERAFNMLEQVSGRAGRHEDNGKVIIQTCKPESPVLEFVKKHDYISFYKSQIADREAFSYPPFTKIINILLKNRDNRVVRNLAMVYAQELRKIFGERVLGPEKPFIGRIATFYIQCIILKIESTASMKKVKEILHQIEAKMASDQRMKSTSVYYDVDPA